MATAYLHAMPDPVASVREWRDVTPSIFVEQILPSGQPALLRGAAAAWPAVRAGLESPAAMSGYIRRFDNGAPADTMFGSPEIAGKFFYTDDLTARNFENRQQPLAASLESLLGLMNAPRPPAVYVGALPMPQALPGFTRENAMPLLDPRVVPRLWLSNKVTVQTHYDLSYNLACVVAGHRRFTLFPPEQVSNLYMGPLEFTLAGQPISMVKLDQPDLERFPKFPEAWKQAQVAELAPGDALFIPYMWWHNVESLDDFNVLVNYWWDDSPGWAGSPFEALIHSLMSIHSLPPEKRAIWKTVFDTFVFDEHGDAAAHLTPRQRGILGAVDPQLSQHARAWLLRALTPRR